MCAREVSCLSTLNFINRLNSLDNNFLDSGGPLTCNGKLVGLASFGVRCSYSINFPGVHTNVFYYKSWIEEEISRNSGYRTVLNFSFMMLSILMASLR